MKFHRSIRWRLQLWYGALLIAVLSGFGLSVYQLERGRQFRRIDDELQRRLPALVESQRPVSQREPQLREFRLAPKDGALFDGGRGDAFYYVVWLQHSDTPVTFSPTAPADAPEPKPGEPTTRQRGELREAFLFPGPGDCVLVGHSTAAEAAGLRQLAWWIGGIGAAVLLLGLAGGGWLVARALRPIREISLTAEKISTGDLTRRISVADTDGELGRLAGVLNATFDRLNAAFAQQARFTADAAHELRTPVAVILTHAENGLAGECANEEHREAFAASRRAAQRMRRLIESLLELARLDAGREKFSRAPLDLAAVTAECAELVRPLAARRQLVVKTDLAPANCHGDGDRLALVITNLLTNAIHHHHRDGGEVAVTTRTENGAAVLTVSDDGPGIRAEHLPRIFDRFYRADAARTTAQGRTGLGLAISKAIVEAHGGTIAAASEFGHGATFTVRLPQLIS